MFFPINYKVKPSQIDIKVNSQSAFSNSYFCHNGCLDDFAGDLENKTCGYKLSGRILTPN